MVVDVGVTVIEAPVPSSVPPQDPEYHFHTAPVPSVPPILFHVIGPPHEGLGVAVAPVGAVDIGVYVKVITAL